MSSDRPKRVVLPQRSAVYTEYRGPKRGLTEATQPLYRWVGTYFADRIEDISVYFSERAASTAGPDDEINVQIVFELDKSLGYRTVLPDEFRQRELPSETLLIYTYRGPLTVMKADIVRWLKKADRKKKLRPGYRQRMVHMSADPHSPDSEVEIAVVL